MKLRQHSRMIVVGLIVVLFFQTASAAISLQDDSYINIGAAQRDASHWCAKKHAAADAIAPGHFIVEHPYNVRKYTLTLEPNFNNGRLTGRTEIKMTITENGVQTIQLNFAGNWNISNVRVNGTSVNYYHDGLILYVDLAWNRYSGEELVISIPYTGFPDNNVSAFYISGNHGYTFSQPFQARYWFPCFDEPSDKADEGVEFFVEVPSSLIVAANGTQVSTQHNSGNTIYHWRHTKPIASYLIAVAIGPYNIIYDQYKNIPLRYYVFPADYSKAEYDFKRHPQMFTAFENRFGNYPFASYGIVEARNFGGAMEHQTMTTWSADWVTGDRENEGIAAHELAHHWWGDSVTLKDYRDIWLNEGFASFSELVWYEHDGGTALRDHYVRHFKNWYLEDDARHRITLYRDNYNSLFATTVYKKGGLVLHMLRWELGDNTFFQGMRTYHNKFRYKGVNTADFRKVMEEVSGRDLKAFFDGWVYGLAWPEYEITSYVEQTNAGMKKIITVKQVQKHNTLFAMTLPIDPDGYGPMKQIRKYVKGKWSQFEVDVNGNSGKATIVPTDWILKTERQGNYPAPTVNSIRNKRLRAGKLNTVVINGNHFTPVSRVTLTSNSVDLQGVIVSDGGKQIELKIRVPKNAGKEKIGFTITNPDGDMITKANKLRVVPK